MDAAHGFSAAFQTAIAKFDEANSQDPNVETIDGLPVPRELLYARRLTAWVLRLAPDASEALQLAARSQHLCRWMIPRDSYPLTKPGYLQWRTELKKFHAQKSAEILRQAGYGQDTIEKVCDLNLKKNFPGNPDGRILEDALCLVFLEFQFEPLAAKTDDEKMINALRKSWNKMTPPGREHALKLPFSEKQKKLIDLALG